MADIYKMLYTRCFTKMSDVISSLEKSKIEIDPISYAFEVITSAIIELKNIQSSSDEYLIELGDDQVDEASEDNEDGQSSEDGAVDIKVDEGNE